MNKRVIILYFILFEAWTCNAHTQSLFSFRSTIVSAITENKTEKKPIAEQEKFHGFTDIDAGHRNKYNAMINDLEKDTKNKRGRPPKPQYPDNRPKITNSQQDIIDNLHSQDNVNMLNVIQKNKTNPPEHAWNFDEWCEILDEDDEISIEEHAEIENPSAILKTFWIS